MIKLVSGFLNSVGGKNTFSMKDPNTDLSAAEIKQSLELLASLDIFEKDGVQLFKKPIEAKYVETVETPIFKGEELFGKPGQPLVLKQPQLTVPPATPVLVEPVVKAETVEEIDPNKLAELKQHSRYQALPAVPQVSLNKPEEDVKAIPETTEELEEKTEESNELQPSSNYRLSEILRKRRNRRKAQEEQKKNPQ
ncbi:DUF2922 domain-containing protein [Enterococcus sp. 669A]|uniref:DUF2922 domain-containing protein n=1 Tax=Candidatus Enterococcus moelleringii TaxID=2815325 RepID=A0ABS3L7J4_9ENTE|nr:DUF2922 domain-containing protein [Enterococcus sp. 669A]MBO1305594.1 DUF2922 domain-containing protein [Enterococcus sp. 669A]